MRSIVADCESTGLTLPSVSDLVKQPHITEFACAVIEDGKLLSEHSWLLNPGIPLSAEITKITGLTDAMLKDQPTFNEVLPMIKELFGKADQLFAHNAPFDCALLTYELQRAACTDFPWPSAIICTVQEFIFEFGFRPKLTELYERKIGKPLAQKHRALSDVQALVEIILKEGLA